VISELKSILTLQADAFKSVPTLCDELGQLGIGYLLEVALPSCSVIPAEVPSGEVEVMMLVRRRWVESEGLAEQRLRVDGRLAIRVLLQASKECIDLIQGSLATGRCQLVEQKRGRIQSAAFEMVSELVGMQVRLLVEALVASLEGTDEWLLARVDSHVRLQVEVKRESLVTELTFVRLFARVHQHMPLEFGVVQESFAAAIVGALE
jgi:hypothetical protein